MIFRPSPRWGLAMRLLTAIPVHNEDAHLEAILDEVLRYADDVLVVDDGSTDRTPELLKAFPRVQVIRHPQNRGYGAGLRSAFGRTLEGGYDDIVSGSRYLKVFDPDQIPPIERRRINIEVTRWLNECLGLNLTDAFCGFKAYRRRAIECFDITDDGYAMPLQVWVQAVEHELTIVEEAVPLIYLDESRAFGGALDDASYRLNHYKNVFRDALQRSGVVVAGGCA
jgi:glycosyltransferase involved in cell wall biosynthesis